MPGRDIIVVGASAGGVEALVQLARGLPPDLPAAVFVVLHVPAQGTSVLPQILNRAGPLPAAHPSDLEPVRRGRIYIAPPDHHLLVKDGRVRVTRGPKENGHRPSVDPLFRTAARNHRNRVIGVILSGNLDDGTAGLAVVRRHGGVSVVQNPEEAHYPSMPRSALDNAGADHVVSLPELPALLVELAREEVPDVGVDPMAAQEPDVAEAGTNAMKNKQMPGPPTSLTCPDCGGSLWELRDGELVRYRCHVGHAYSPESLMSEQNGMMESALWTALRALDESTDLARRLSERAQRNGNPITAANFERLAEERDAKAALLRRVLTNEPDAGRKALEANPIRQENLSPGRGNGAGEPAATALGAPRPPAAPGR